MNGLVRLLLVLAGLAIAAAAPAAEVLRTVPPRLDPARAYALVEIRNHDGGPQAGIVTLARYDAAGGDVRGGLRSPGSSLGRDVAVRTTISRRPLLRTEQARLYLLELEPDTWVIEGAGGTAFSLDSKTFTIAAGEVLDLGVFSPSTDWPEGEGPQRLTVGRLAGLALLGPFARMPEPRPAMLAIRPREPDDLAVPEGLRAAIRPADYGEGARFGNYLGGLVNRIDGRRGRPGAQPAAAPGPVEATAASDPPSPTATSDEAQPAAAPEPAQPTAAPEQAPPAAAPERAEHGQGPPALAAGPRTQASILLPSGSSTNAP